MPIFEYHCRDCGSDFEKLVRKSSDEVLCPSCGESHLETRYSTFASRAPQSAAAPQAGGGCPAGMCGTPGLCGRN